MTELLLWAISITLVVLSLILLTFALFKLFSLLRKQRFRQRPRLRKAYRRTGRRNTWARYILPVLLVLLPAIYYAKNDLENLKQIHERNRDLTKSDNNPHLFPARKIKMFSSEPERKEQCQEAFEYLNQLREKYGRNKLSWDDRAYNLAVARSKDMIERNYFDHVTPEGTCAGNFKSAFGFVDYENIPENIGGMTHYDNGNPVENTSVREAVNGWMESRGHRYNLLYQSHQFGAIGCYKSICAFYGVNPENRGFGSGPCTTGEQGLEYWKTAPIQPGEVNSP